MEAYPKEISFTYTSTESSIIALFKPNLTPEQMFKMGSFGGTYWRPIKSAITGKNHKNRHVKFKKLGWWNGISNKHLTSDWSKYDVNINKYKVKCGSTLEAWEEKEWIKKQDPYGWVEWYCNFYNGRRSPDDERQIKRWLAFCGPTGRFKRNLIKQIKEKGGNINDYSISPVIRQSLQHWAYQITEDELTV
jgi:hypothetical protein